MADEISGPKKFGIGFAGGTTPYLLSFATFCMTTFSYATLPDKFTALGRITGVTIFACVGGLLSLIWDKKEKDLRRLYVIGMGAPAILFSMYINVQRGYGANAGTPHVVAVENPNRVLSRFETLNKVLVGRAAFAASFEIRSDSMGGALDDNPSRNRLLRISQSDTSTTSDSRPSALLKFLNGLLHETGLGGSSLTLTIALSAFTAVLLTFGGYRAVSNRERDEALRKVEEQINELAAALASSGSDRVVGQPPEAKMLREQQDPLERGVGALGERRWGDAVNDLNIAIGNVASALFYRSLAYRELGRFSDSLRDLDTYRELKPEDARITPLRGWLLRQLDRDQEALNLFENEVRQEPKNAAALANKGLALQKLNRPKEAFEALSEALGLLPNIDLGKNSFAGTIMLNQALAASALGQWKDALEIIEHVLELLPADQTTQLRQLEAQALSVKAALLEHLGRHADSLKTGDEMLNKFLSSDDVEIQSSVAQVLFNRGVSFAKGSQADQALASYAQVVERFGESRELRLQRCVARALVNKGYLLGARGDFVQQSETYNELVRLFGQSDSTELQEAVARALFNGAALLQTRGKNREAIVAFDELIARFKDATDLQLLNVVADALSRKASMLEVMNRDSEALAIWDELLQRFEPNADSMSETFAQALCNKAGILHRAGRDSEALEQLDDVLRRFASSSEPSIRIQILRVLANKAISLRLLGRYEELLATTEEMLQRIGYPEDAVTRELAANAMMLRAEALKVLNRESDASAAYREIVSRFAEDRSPAIQAMVQLAMKAAGNQV